MTNTTTSTATDLETNAHAHWTLHIDIASGITMVQERINCVYGE